MEIQKTDETICERCNKPAEFWVELSDGEYVCEECGEELESEALMRLEDNNYNYVEN